MAARWAHNPHQEIISLSNLGSLFWLLPPDISTSTTETSSQNHIKSLKKKHTNLQYFQQDFTQLPITSKNNQDQVNQVH